MRVGGKPNVLSFKDSINLGHIDLDWDENNVKGAIANSQECEKKENKDACKLVAKDFVMLKENYRRAGQYDWEDASHRAYMEYNTKALRWSFSKKGIFKKLFFKLFGAISGYGTKVTNILLTCVFIIAIFAVLDSLGSSSMFFDSFTYSINSFLTIGNGSALYFDTCQWLSALEGFLGLLLMSLVTVVIARKLIR